MAIVRCRERHSPPQGKTHSYRLGVAPAGDGEGVRCGHRGCPHKGLVWLDVPEAADFQGGEREFHLHNGYQVKFRVSDAVIMRANG